MIFALDNISFYDASFFNVKLFLPEHTLTVLNFMFIIVIEALKSLMLWGYAGLEG